MLTNKIQFYFNKATHTYDTFSRVQQLVAEHLISMLYKTLSHANAILDVGCGSGLVTSMLAKHITYNQFLAIDIAEKSLEHAKAKFADTSIQFLQHNFQQPILYTADLIFSNMSLQWSSNLEETFKLFTHNLTGNGLIAFSLPLAGTFDTLHPNSRNKFHEMEFILEKLKLHYDLLYIHHELIPQTFETLRDALYSIKNVGANYINNSSNKGLHNKAFLNTILPASHDGYFHLNYCIGYFIARKTCL